MSWSDTDLLRALHKRDHEGALCKDIAASMGRTKNSVIGALNRIDKDTAIHDPDGHQNGTMKPLWWKKGRTK